MEPKRLTLLEAREQARAEAREGELVARLWRGDDDMWRVAYARVIDVGGYRTTQAGRTEDLGIAVRP